MPIYSPSVIRKLVSFYWNGTDIIIVRNIGIAAVTRLATGRYNIEFETDFPTVNYQIVGSANFDPSSQTAVPIIGVDSDNVRTVSKCGVVVGDKVTNTSYFDVGSAAIPDAATITFTH